MKMHITDKSNKCAECGGIVEEIDIRLDLADFCGACDALVHDDCAEDHQERKHAE